MNEKDKEEFDKFYNKHYGFQDFKDAAIEAWQSACDYKQKEIEERWIKQLKNEHSLYQEHLRALEKEIEKLEE